MLDHTLPDSDPLEALLPTPIPGGTLHFQVEYTTYQAWTAGSRVVSRRRPNDTPSITMHRDYFIQVAACPVGYPMSYAQCSVEFYPASNADVAGETQLAAMRALFTEVEKHAARSGLRLHRADTSWPFKYWTNSFNQRRISQHGTRFSPADRAYRPHDSMTEAIATTVHQELIHQNHGFQLTLDHSAPSIELEAIIADDISWPNVQQCTADLGVMANNNPTWQHPPFSSIQLRLSLGDREEPVLLSVPTLPLNDDYQVITTHGASIGHAHHIVTIANATARKYALYAQPLTEDEFLSEVSADAFTAAWNTIRPDHTHTAYQLFQLSQKLAQNHHQPIIEPISLTAPGSPFTIVAYPVQH